MVDDDDVEASQWWRRVAATMVHVNAAYRRLPGPLRAVIWLLPALLARLLGLPLVPWP